MQTSTEAEENLRVIRSLMEKATIYRAISAPTALVGGLVSVLFGAWLHLKSRTLFAVGEIGTFGQLFFYGWLAVLVITISANGIFIWHAARLRKEPFISAAMRKALWALLPPILCGAVFTVLAVLLGTGSRWSLPPVWMIFYGLGLLATSQFSPRSIPVLGWLFLVTGLLCNVIDDWTGWARLLGREEVSRPTGANFLMVGTFGFYHLIYAACTWPRRTRGGA